MLLNVCVAGLLGLASSPLQSLVTARAVGDWKPTASEARDITARGFDWPTLKMKDINDKIGSGKTEVYEVKNDKGKEVLQTDKVFVKTKDGAEHELEVYKDIKGKDISFEILAVIVKDNNENEAVGFVQHAVESEDTQKGDLEACKSVLEKLHEAGWLHMDNHKKNYKKVGDKFYAFDFEDSLRTDDESAYDEEDDEDRKEKDFLMQSIHFNNPFTRAKN